MKTNPSARYLVKIQRIMVCVALAAIVGLEFYLGASLASRIGQTTACQTDTPAAPDVNIWDLMAAAR
jgi:hypothetical protein